MPESQTAITGVKIAGMSTIDGSVERDVYLVFAPRGSEPPSGCRPLFSLCDPFNEWDAYYQPKVNFAPEEADRLREALLVAAERFADLAAVIKENGSYDNAGFMQASAERCRHALGVSSTP